MDLFDLIEELAHVPSASGAEAEALPFYRRALSPFTQTVEADRFGNIKAVFGDGRFFLDAHTDKIGLIVTHIDDDGFLHAAPVGSVDTRVLPASDLTVYGKEPLYATAVSTPPHLDAGTHRAEKAEDILFDIGCDAVRARALVSPGDRILFRAPTERLGEHIVCSPYLDNSVGAAVLLLCAGKLHACGGLDGITLCFSAQEEAGLRGAAASVYGGSYSFLLSVDTSFARAPGVRPEKSGARGGGPMIGYSPILSREDSRLLTDLAREMDMPHTCEVMGARTGTNADVLSNAYAGCPTALISVPITNMHTPSETVDLRDIDDAATLITEFILRKKGQS